MKHTRMISMVTIIGTLLAVSPAFAGNGGPRGFHGRQDKFNEKWLDHAVKGLELTPDQEATFRSLHADHKTSAAPIREKVKALRSEMRETWQEPELDEGNIMEISREIHRLKAELAELRISLRIDIHKILTPEQRDRLAQGPGRRG